MVENERSPGVWSRKSEQHPQRRRLAGAVWPEEAGDRAGFELERQVVDRQNAAEALRQRLGYNDRRYAITRSAGVVSEKSITCSVGVFRTRARTRRLRARTPRLRERTG